MAYAEKYYFTFVGLDGKNYECEIHEDGFTGTTTEIRASVDPFVITYPEVELFTPVRGSGCKMKLFATSDRQFINLYTADMMQYQIILKKNGGPYWWGYLDSEIYSEDFQYIDNYEVSFTGTDGLALLDRIYYLDEGGNDYTGTTSQWEIISNILDKLNIVWSAIFVKLETTITNITLDSDETIFHRTYIRNENFYDEDGSAMTCRKVLESILQPYGAFLTISSNYVYITDNIIILPQESEPVTFKQYSSADFTYVQDIDINLNLGDLSDIGFANSNQQLTMVNGINEQVVSYSPYRQSEMINFDASKDLTGSTVLTVTRGSTNYQWEENYVTDSTLWDKYNNGSFCNLEGIDGENIGLKDYYLNINKYTGWCTEADPNQLSYVYKKTLPLITHNEKFGIKISMQGFTRISSDLNGTRTPDSVKHTRLICRLEVGDMKFHWKSGVPKVYGWYFKNDTPLELELDFVKRTSDGYEFIEDQWIDLQLPVLYPFDSGTEDDVVKDQDFIIPFWNLLKAGYFTFSIYGFSSYSTDPDVTDAQANLVDEVQDFRIKDIKFDIVYADGSDVPTKDIEYKGYLNPLYKNSGEKITNTCGFNSLGYPIEKAAMMIYTGLTFLSLETGNTLSNIQEWTKWGSINSIEKLLLRSIVSNYQTPSVQLNCTINRIETIVGRLTFNNYFDKNFAILGCEHNLSEATSQITIREVKYDSLYINTV
jgi:hypothetical protein